MVRVFASWLYSFDPLNEVPPSGLISGKPRRTRPYIYTDQQVVQIVAKARRLRSFYGLRGWTCATLFGLIAVTGLRVSEALGLDDKDVDLDPAVLTINRTKNGRSRSVPLLPCAAERLRSYRAERNRIVGRGAKPFFVHENGERLGDCSIRYNFALVCQGIRLRELQVFKKARVAQ